MEVICNKKDCTGCGTCRVICPKKAIELVEDTLGALYPIIDGAKCVDCKLCLNNCPQVNPPLFSTPIKVFAGWSNDEKKQKEQCFWRNCK